MGDLRARAYLRAPRFVDSSKVAMVGDLLDLTRGHLGSGIPVECAEMSLGNVVHAVVDEIRAAHPEAKIRVEARGEARGETDGRWDAARLVSAHGGRVAVEPNEERGTTFTVRLPRE